MQHSKKTIIALAALFSMGFAGTSMAETKDVSKFTYKNNGTYDAYFNVRYNKDGKNCQVYLDGNAFTGLRKVGQRIGNVEVDLNSTAFKVESGGNTCKGAIPDGTRVWGKVYIEDGDKESCKKSVELIKQGSGKTVSYRTGGTTLKDNRCKQDIN